MSPTRQPDARPAGDLIAERVRDVRTRRNLTQRQLATILRDEYGYNLDATKIAKIESSLPDRRRVTVDDLLVLAAALNVSPIALLAPRGFVPHLAIGRKTIHPDLFRSWARGLDAASFDVGNASEAVDSETRAAYFDEATDHEKEAARQIPSLLDLRDAIASIEVLAGRGSEYDEFAAAMEDLRSSALKRFNEAVQRVRAEMKGLAK